jgi:hypothetical protein
MKRQLMALAHGKLHDQLSVAQISIWRWKMQGKAPHMLLPA